MCPVTRPQLEAALVWIQFPASWAQRLRRLRLDMDDCAAVLVSEP
jgi:hypothetical protein